MDVLEAIRARRSIKAFTERPVPDETIDALLDLAVLAPNHRLTEPWRFVVLGREACRAYARIKAERRAARVDDADAAEEIRRRSMERLGAVPATLAFLQRLDPDPEVREEDFASVYMAMQNVLLGAVALGLGTHVKTGAVLDAPETREALGAEPEERVVALVELGEPAEVPPAKPREGAARWTRRLP
jgi:nitroreductase